MTLIELIKLDEGFIATVYKDSLGFDTVGYGTKMPLSREEGELLLKYRLDITEKNLLNNLHYLSISHEAWEILYNMAYQMGVNGVIKFTKMIKALRIKDYNEAANQMLDSKWAKQTPQRANRLADRMRGI